MFRILGLDFRSIRGAPRSPLWRKVRSQIIKECGQCSACGTTSGLEVHHIVPVHINPSLELDMENLIVLCSRSCHLLIGHLMDYKSWNTNVVEDAKKLNTKIKTRPYRGNNEDYI